MGFIFSKIAKLISTEFSDIESFVGKEYYQAMKHEYEIANPSPLKPAKTEYLYDVYISCPRDAYQWMHELFVPALIEYLNDELGYNPQLFFDFNELNSHDSYFATIESVIQKSKIFLLVITDSIKKESNFQNMELNWILNREKNVSNNLLFTVLYSNSEMSAVNLLPEYLQSRQYINLSSFRHEETFKSTRLRAQFGQEIGKLSAAIAQSILGDNHIPPDTSNEINAGISEINELLLQLAKEYENIRMKLPGGNSRTQIMENIVTNMKKAMPSPINLLSVLTKSKSAGERLLAIASLQKFPNIEYVGWLAEHVGNVERPFVGYQASVALYIASRAYGREHKDQMKITLRSAEKNIRNYEHQDPNQLKIIETSLDELNYSD